MGWALVHRRPGLDDVLPSVCTDHIFRITAGKDIHIVFFRHSYSNPYEYTYIHSFLYALCDGHAYIYPFTNAHANRHPYPNKNQDSYIYSLPYTHLYRDLYAHADGYRSP